MHGGIFVHNIDSIFLSGPHDGNQGKEKEEECDGERDCNVGEIEVKSFCCWSTHCAVLHCVEL